MTADLYPYLSLESNSLVNLEKDKLARVPLGKSLLVYTKCKHVFSFSAIVHPIYIMFLISLPGVFVVILKFRIVS